MKRSRSTAALVPSPAIHRRLFVVGCPGAGATVVRDLLAMQPGLHAFPRTHLFLRSFGMRGRRLPWAWFGLTLGKERRILERLVERSSHSGAVPALPPRSLLLRRSLDGLLATFDRLALAAGCRNWVDTTPRHLVHARLIERTVPRARIVHVVRDGRDVVAAQCSGEGRHAPRAVVSEWNRALAHHARCLDRPGHLFVLYEDLMADPMGEMVRLLHQCGLQHGSGELASAIAELDAYPANDDGPRRHDLRLRFRERFPAARRRRIEGALHLDRYGAFAERLRRQQAGRTSVRLATAMVEVNALPAASCPTAADANRGGAIRTSRPRICTCGNTKPVTDVVLHIGLHKAATRVFSSGPCSPTSTRIASCSIPSRCFMTCARRRVTRVTPPGRGEPRRRRTEPANRPVIAQS
ncbi:MAG: sulfotransferase [Halofilum sp. (in: g-proteobacteria)]|nr:sulfotransferase [Halofilum sp. (in: g-proteobacteria)]